MHGKNAETWNKRVTTAAERFDYLYDRDELQEWVPRIERLASEAREVHVLMNNCHRDYSVRNAREIGEMLGVFVGPGSSVQGSSAQEQATGKQEEERQERLL